MLSNIEFENAEFIIEAHKHAVSIKSSKHLQIMKSMLDMEIIEKY